MPEIDFKVTRLYDENFDVDSRYDVVVNKGGSGSSKTHSLIQVILQKGLENIGIKILILRKIRATLSKSVYMQFMQYIKEIGIYNEHCEYKSELYYILPNETQIHFCGFDDKDKLKSTEWNIIWMEEGNEFTFADYNFVTTRKYRGDKFPNLKPIIYISFNPEACWIEKFESNPNVKLIHSTYKDNPFCNEEYKKTLEALKEADESFYTIYALGQYAVLPNKIYKPFISIAKGDYPKEYDVKIYGCDFGWNNPTALYLIGYKDKVRYIIELIYRSELTNRDLINKLNELKINPNDSIYCDSAEPQRIQEICDNGFNALPSDKSRKDGIDYIKSVHKDIRTCPENIYINEECSIYSYMKDKGGNLIDEPIKFKDHGLDAIRYAIYTHEKEIQPRITFV